MNQTPALGLPAAIEAAVRRVKLAARHAAERTVDSLGVSALASANVFQREALLSAQFELNRKLASFCNGFDDTLDRRIERELLPRSSVQSPLAETSWDALSLVDNHEVEVQVSAERFGMQIAQDCEAEQRELDGFVSSALQGFGEAPRNPLRPELIGNAMVRSIDRLTDRAELRTVLDRGAWPLDGSFDGPDLCGHRRRHACGRPEAGAAQLPQLRARHWLRTHELRLRHLQPAGRSGRSWSCQARRNGRSAPQRRARR